MITPYLLATIRPPGQACGQEVRPRVGRDRQQEVRGIQIEEGDAEDLRVRDADGVERDVDAARLIDDLLQMVRPPPARRARRPRPPRRIPPAAAMSCATASTAGRRRPVTKTVTSSRARRGRRHRRSHLPLRRSRPPCPSTSSLRPFSRVVGAVDYADTATARNWVSHCPPTPSTTAHPTAKRQPPSSRLGRCLYSGVKARTKVTAVTADLMARARAGDDRAFRQLTEPYGRELHVHCYRMLGSFQDAEDALQDTLAGRLAGSRRLRGTRLGPHLVYRIATNRCLNARRSAGGRTPRSGTCPTSSRPSRPASARSCGSSRIPTPGSRVRSTHQPARRRATSRPRRSRWPS